MSLATTLFAPWWRPRWVMRMLVDLIADELRRLRPGVPPPHFGLPSVVDNDTPDDFDADLDEVLGLDSIELLVGHPCFFSFAAGDADVRVADDVVAVTSTGQCPAFVWEALADLGVARMLEVYGSSECAGIASRWNVAEPLTLLPWWVVEPGRERLLRADAAACIAADRWEWVDGRRFRVRGRLDGAVQVAGENVFPGRVRDVLLAHPAVADAAVRPFGSGVAVRLKADVVPTDPDADPTNLRLELIAWLAERLRPAERPRHIDIGPALPQTPAGTAGDR